MTTDFHSHLIPGVDDGAADLDQARAALGRMAEAGVGALVATPHLDASLAERPGALERRLAQIDQAWELLAAAARDGFPELRVERGAEVKLDTPTPDLSDPRLRLAGGRFVLVEFAGFMVPPRSEAVLEAIASDGYLPVLAHPERYLGLDREGGQAERWREAGAFLQVNAGSLVGHYGGEAQANARRLLREGAVAYLCSDYHARGTPPIEEPRRWVADTLGEETASMLFDVNPRRLLEGLGPLPPPPIASRSSLLERLAGLFQ